MSGGPRARTSPLRATVPLSCVTKGGKDAPKGAAIRRTASLDAIHRRLAARPAPSAAPTHTDRASSLDSLQALVDAVEDKGAKVGPKTRRDDKGAQSRNLPSPFAKSSVVVPPKSSRNSEEGLNQELELYANVETLECDRLQEPIPEGRKAPVAELIREGPYSRIYQPTNPNSSDSPLRDSVSPVPSFLDTPHSETDVEPPLTRFYFAPEDSQGSSPDQERILSGSSPQINRFSSSAPPDGCDRVLSKSVPILRPIPREIVVSSHPNTSFTLKPSSYSAFESLQTSKDSSDDSPKVPEQEDP
ncbi:protein FAM117B isoform X2 [Tribolium castaneum]|uniref:protein FAM117B isoform X2 n=1 Tax=Tribolium castaneum TaxID=7070 RepID=UPI0030FE94DE